MPVFVTTHTESQNLEHITHTGGLWSSGAVNGRPGAHVIQPEGILSLDAKIITATSMTINPLVLILSSFFLYPSRRC